MQGKFSIAFCGGILTLAVSGTPGLAQPLAHQPARCANSWRHVCAKESLRTLTCNGSLAPPEFKYYVPNHTVKAIERLVRDGVALDLLHVAPASIKNDLNA
jgi:hypothetical protein